MSERLGKWNLTIFKLTLTSIKLTAINKERIPVLRYPFTTAYVKCMIGD